MGLLAGGHMFSAAVAVPDPTEVAIFFARASMGMLVGGGLQSFGLSALVVFIGRS